MACGRDANKVKIRKQNSSSQGEENEGKPSTITQHTTAVTNKAICKRRARGLFKGGNHSDRYIIYSLTWPVPYLLRGRGTQWVSLPSFVLVSYQEDSFCSNRTHSQTTRQGLTQNSAKHGLFGILYFQACAMRGCVQSGELNVCIWDTVHKRKS